MTFFSASLPGRLPEEQLAVGSLNTVHRRDPILEGGRNRGATRGGKSISFNLYTVHTATNTWPPGQLEAISYSGLQFD